MSSEQNMHELGNEVTSQDLVLPGRKSSNCQVLRPCPDEVLSATCSVECGKNYESVIYHQVISDLNKETSVAYLQKELEILRANNKKLQEKLAKEDKEKRKLKLQLDLHEKAAEAAIAERTAALVEEVYFAQRERDEAIMCRLQLALEERDEAIARMKHMEMSLKILHKSLSQEETLKDQFNHALSIYEDALKNRESVVSITQQQNEELATQLQQALTEHADMELQLQCAVEVSRAASEKVQKLERLVDVLRKKVGTGTVRTVI
uniref:Mirror-image polydactyly 1 n=1 Tax=Rattus norvegicus TaxID=10116 RepID=A0ABK0LNC9_RAT